MFQFNSDDQFALLNSEFAMSHSRREMIKRLMTLGLVAAGGAALAPLAVEAKPKKGGKKNRHNDGDGPSAELTIIDLPDPVVTRTLTIDSRANNLTYPVTVAGTITFDPELLALMQRGRQFALVCYLNANDSDPGVRVHLPAASGFRDIWGGSGATASVTFKFFDNVHSSLLQDDTVTEDDIHAKLYIKSRRTTAHSWKTVTLSNGLTYYKTNEISRHF